MTTENPKTIGFVGGGAMAEAILKGLLSRELFAAKNVRVGEPVETRRADLTSRYGLQAFPTNSESIQGADIVILAVKPQHLGGAMVEIKGKIASEALVLSIVAGAKIETIGQGLAHDRIVRVMPNTPAQIGEGMSVWTATQSVGASEREIASQILSCLGKEIFAPEEKYLDMATAVNGSGPGYVFLFLEAFVDAAVHLGFARPVAEELVLQTVLGSVKMAQGSKQHLAELRNLVTSPAGTTAAGIFELEEGGMRSVIDRAVMAAYERSVELGKK